MIVNVAIPIVQFTTKTTLIPFMSTEDNSKTNVCARFNFVSQTNSNHTKKTKNSKKKMKKQQRIGQNEAKI